MIPKFRVWDPYYKKMFANDQIIIWDGNVYVNDADKITVDNMKGWSIDDKYLMQSTGLFDNSEPPKEIFEGDVVRMRSGELLQVNLHHGMFIPVCFYVSSAFEREGNVFENPELLEDPDFREEDL